MKVQTPQIAWHNRDRVSSVSIQPFAYPTPLKEGGTRIATGGDDTHVVIWEFITNEAGRIEPQCVCDLTRHQSSVSAVRWSPDGKLLASADLESAIFLWRYSENEAVPDLFGEGNLGEEEEIVNQENWTAMSTLRGHLQDVIGLSWSPCSQFLVSCSTDNTAIVFDVKKGTKLKMLDDHKGWVNGVCWDPLNKFIATIASDRILRVYNTKNYKNLHKTYKAELPIDAVCPQTQNGKRELKTTENETKSSEKTNNENETPNNKEVQKAESKEDMLNEEFKNVRLFHDDTFQSFFRRLDMSPDGQLLVIPSGVLEIDGEADIKNCTYVFSRTDLSRPVLFLPSREISVAVKFSPIKYELRPVARTDGVEEEEGKPWTKYQTLFALPYRLIYAVATKNKIVFYDTQQAEPFARVSNIHYVSLNDLAWSCDGNMLVVSSTDGFCSVIKFMPEEIGTAYSDEEADLEPLMALDDTDADLEPLDDSAIDADDELMLDDIDSDDDMVPVSKDGIPLNKEGVCSPAAIKIRSVKEGGKPNPKRLQLITISSPKASSKSQDEENTDEKDLKLILEESTQDMLEQKAEKETKKKRVPFVTLT